MMKNLTEILTMVSLLTTMTGPAFATCRTDERWPDLSAWLCDLNAELSRKDAGEDYTRHIDLITDKPEISSLRILMTQSEDEVCRRHDVDDYGDPLKRILNHQGLPETFSDERRKFAAAEIWNESTQGPLLSCESQTLDERDGGDSGQAYRQYYYLKFGPAREGKHLIIRVETHW